jgi:GDP-L-fucose synthase
VVYIFTMRNIIVTGGSGLLGKSLKNKEPNFIYLSSKDVNLTDYTQTKQVLGIHNPHTIIHLAGKVGGIKDNSENPYDFIYANNTINTNVIDYCVKRKIKLIFASSTCVYPKNAKSYPLTEDMVNDGEPESTNDAYAYAKRFARNTLVSANKQYGLNYTVLYFCNLYGEHDEFFNDKKSHLVTSLIQKFHNAKINNLNKVVLWGTGKPLRQFMHSDDAAEIIKIVLNNNITGEYNVAIEDNLTVKEIAEIVKDVIGFNGDIEFNGNLDGVYRKDASSKRLLDTIGGYNFIRLKEGIDKTYKTFLEKHYVEIDA